MEHLKSTQELIQHVSVHSGLNWNLAVLVFLYRGKPENPFRRKNLLQQGENQQQTQPTYDARTRNRTLATLVGGACSHHCATRAPLGPIIITVCLGKGGGEEDCLKFGRNRTLT